METPQSAIPLPDVLKSPCPRTIYCLCAASEILPLTDEVIVKAADIYADLKRLGTLVGDGDILIGATALVHGLGS